MSKRVENRRSVEEEIDEEAERDVATSGGKYGDGVYRRWNACEYIASPLV
jgi:hypothetical protein